MHSEGAGTVWVRGYMVRWWGLGGCISCIKKGGDWVGALHA